MPDFSITCNECLETLKDRLHGSPVRCKLCGAINITTVNHTQEGL